MQDLAQLTTGTITVVDNHLPFLDSVSAWAGKAGVSGRIRTVCASMDALPFDPGTFDLIWSEGAIIIVGFEAGRLRLVATYRLSETGWWALYHVPQIALIAELQKFLIRASSGFSPSSLLIRSACSSLSAVAAYRSGDASGAA